MRRSTSWRAVSGCHPSPSAHMLSAQPSIQLNVHLTSIEPNGVSPGRCPASSPLWFRRAPAAAA